MRSSTRFARSARLGILAQLIGWSAHFLTGDIGGALVTWFFTVPLGICVGIIIALEGFKETEQVGARMGAKLFLLGAVHALGTPLLALYLGAR